MGARVVLAIVVLLAVGNMLGNSPPLTVGAQPSPTAGDFLPDEAQIPAEFIYWPAESRVRQGVAIERVYRRPTDGASLMVVSTVHPTSEVALPHCASIVDSFQARGFQMSSPPFAPVDVPWQRSGIGYEQTPDGIQQAISPTYFQYGGLCGGVIYSRPSWSSGPFVDNYAVVLPMVQRAKAIYG